MGPLYMAWNKWVSTEVYCTLLMLLGLVSPHLSGQIIIFHQPIYISWNSRGFPLLVTANLGWSVRSPANLTRFITGTGASCTKPVSFFVLFELGDTPGGVVGNIHFVQLVVVQSRLRWFSKNGGVRKRCYCKQSQGVLEQQNSQMM